MTRLHWRVERRGFEGFGWLESHGSRAFDDDAGAFEGSARGPPSKLLPGHLTLEALGAGDGGSAGQDDAHGDQDQGNRTVKETFESEELVDRHKDYPFFEFAPRKGPVRSGHR